MKSEKKITYRHFKFIAPAISASLILLIFLFSNRLSCGSKIIAGLDMEQSYYTLIEYLMGVIKGEKSLWFSWANGLGQGMESTLAYYTFSPVNLIYLLFPKSMILQATAIVITVKVALAAYMMQIFLSYFLKSNRISTVIFSVCYSLCAFQVIFYFAMNLVDSIYILPLIMLGAAKLIRENKVVLIACSYILLFGYNFYMGYMIGLSSFILIAAYFIYSFNKRDNKKNISICVKYISSVLLSLAVTAWIWMPAVRQLLVFGEDDVSSNVPYNTNPILLFANLLCSQYQDLNGYTPYVYCGLISVSLFILFFLNKRIKKNVKLLVAFVTIAFTLLMCIPSLNYFMHAFDTAQMIGFRYSFVFSFIITVTACYEISFFKSNEKKDLYIAATIMAVLYVSSLMIFKALNQRMEAAVRFEVIALNVIFAVIYFLIRKSFMQKKINLQRAGTILLVSVCAEILISYVSVYSRIDDGVSENFYYAAKAVENSSIESLQNIKDDEFGRVQAICIRNNNVGIDHNVNTLAVNNNNAHKNLMKFLDDIGMEVDTHRLTSRGMNDVTRALFSVKYYSNIETENHDDIFWYVQDDEVAAKIHEFNYPVQGCTWDINDKSLSLGFMGGNNLSKLIFTESPFDNQNILLTALCGEEINCYEEIVPTVKCKNAVIVPASDIKDQNIDLPEDLDTEKGSVIFRTDAGDITDDTDYSEFSSCVVYEFEDVSEPVYSYFDKKYSFVSPSYLITEDNSSSKYQKYPTQKLSETFITKVGKNSVGNYEELIYLTDGNTMDYYDNAYFVKFNEEEFERAYNILSKNQFIINSVNDGYVDGNISVKNNGIMFTGIPYSDGWSAVVDGVSKEVTPICNDSLVGVELETGEHSIQLIYKTPLLTEGIIVSLIGAIGFAVWILTSGVVKVRKEKV